jgi:hypothetical protein
MFLAAIMPGTHVMTSFALLGLFAFGIGSGARISVAKNIVRHVQRTAANSPQSELLKISGAFENLASSSSYAMKEGIMHNFGLEDCNELTANGLTCFANNPSSPYGVLMMPQPDADGQEEDWSQCGTKWMPLCKQNGAGEKVAVPWHMSEQEAIVVLGTTPPEMKYFGFVNYVYAHTFPESFEIDPSVASLKRCWDEGSSERKCDVFASLGDAVNQGNIKVVANSTSSGVYDQNFAMVITASEAVYQEVESMLKEAGMNAVNLMPLPGADLDMGFGDEKDTVANLLRTAFPADSSAYATWLDSRFFVYRLTPQKVLEVPKLYSRPTFCDSESEIPPSSYCLTQRSKIDEASRVGLTMESLKAGQSFILDEIAKRMGYLSDWRSSKTDFEAGVPDNGYGCLDMGQKCQGDSRDTYYPASSQLIMNALKPGAIASKVRQKMGLAPLTPQEMMDWKFLGIPSALPDQHKRANLSASKQDSMFVVGVVHSGTKSAEYSSLSIYDLWKLQGIMAVSDNDFAGSADAYLKGTEYEALSPYLYVVEFTRGHCEGRAFCKDVPSTGSLSIPLDTPLLFIERMYYDPLTHIGLDAAAAVPARMIHLA